MLNGDSASLAGRLSGRSLSRIGIMVLLFSVAAIAETLRLSSLRDPDIWLHLRVGSWILEHQTWPTNGLFSQSANLPWRDFSWGYDVFAALVYRVLGLRAVPALLMVFRMVLAAVVFLLAGGLRTNFWISGLLSAVAQCVLSGLGPVAGVSAVLFGVELLLLMESRRSGNLRQLLLLPLLFLFWANLDIGFLYGIGLYALYLFALTVEKLGQAAKANWIEVGPPGMPIGTAASVGAACLIATLLSPYGYHAYSSFFAIQASPANRYLPGHTAMSFHQPNDYLLLLLAMTAFLSLGIRRSRDLFLLSTLVACAALSFHAQGENWLVTLAAAATIGNALPRRAESPAQQRVKYFRWREPSLAAAVAVLVVALAFAFRVPRGREHLLARISETFPVRACDQIRDHRLPAPLFNSYAWGSFLTWYLPEYPVAIDGRRGLYPDEEETDYFKVMLAQIPYQSFPPMQRARTLLLDKQGVMGEALRGVPGFHVAYEDSISVVLLQEKKE